MPEDNVYINVYENVYERHGGMKKNLRQKVYQEIKRRILFFEIKPREKLFESDIANELKISRTPVREALLMLQHERLLEFSDKRGFCVRKLTQKEVREYLAIRSILEHFAVPLIINNITNSEISALKQNISTAENAIQNDDVNSLIACETEFHQILYQSTKSEVFVETISFLTDKFQWLRAIALSAKGGGRQSLNDHIEICEAIEKRDIDKLVEGNKNHFIHAEEYFEAVQKFVL